MKSSDSIKVWSKKETILTYEKKNNLFKAEKLLLDKYLEVNMKVLDLACGTGRISKYILKKTKYIKGIDISEEMLAIYKKQLPMVECECIPIEKMNESGNYYDMILIPYNSLDYVSPKDMRTLVLEKIYDYLKPGGILIFSSHNNLGSFGVWLYSMRPGTLLRSIGKIIKLEVFKTEGYFSNNLFGTNVEHYFGHQKKIICDVENLGFQYIEQRGGNLSLENNNFNNLLETWVYYVFRKPNI